MFGVVRLHLVQPFIRRRLHVVDPLLVVDLRRVSLPDAVQDLAHLVHRLHRCSILFVAQRELEQRAFERVEPVWVREALDVRLERIAVSGCHRLEALDREALLPERGIFEPLAGRRACRLFAGGRLQFRGGRDAREPGEDARPVAPSLLLGLRIRFRLITQGRGLARGRGRQTIPGDDEAPRGSVGIRPPIHRRPQSPELPSPDRTPRADPDAYPTGGNAASQRTPHRRQPSEHDDDGVFAKLRHSREPPAPASRRDEMRNGDGTCCGTGNRHGEFELPRCQI